MTNADRYGTRMVGDCFEVVPAQSAFGCIARLMRLNHFSHPDLYRMFGLRLRRSDDLHRVLARSGRRQAALADALGIRPADEWRSDHWHPFQGSYPDIGSEAFRYCFACIRVGYHCLLHQLPWVSACPWHGVRLTTGCPKCGGTIAVSGDAGRPLLTCGCGMDLIDERAAARLVTTPAGVAEVVSSYLAWARKSREGQVLLGAPETPFLSQTAQALVRVPASVVGSTGRAPVLLSGLDHGRIYHVYAGGRSIALASDARHLETLAADCPQMLELPKFLLGGVRAAARELAYKLPAGSLTEREQLLFLGSPDVGTSGFTEADRPTSGTVRCLPPMAVGPRRFLDLSSIHPVVLRTVRLLEPASTDAIAPDELAIRRRVQRDLLCRGYAEGMRAVLSRYVPGLHGRGRNRPHLTAGWVLLRTHPPYGARVAFTRIDTWSNAADSLSAARLER